jgi:hypothetical protein
MNKKLFFTKEQKRYYKLHNVYSVFLFISFAFLFTLGIIIYLQYINY